MIDLGITKNKKELRLVIYCGNAASTAKWLHYHSAQIFSFSNVVWSLIWILEKIK